jgi:hypothetical protein
VAVNHPLDRKQSAVERLEHTFGTFSDDLHDGLTPVAPNAGPELDLLARDVKHGWTTALLTCLDRAERVAYVLGEVFGVSSTEGAWICGRPRPPTVNACPGRGPRSGRSSASTAGSSPYSRPLPLPHAQRPGRRRARRGRGQDPGTMMSR